MSDHDLARALAVVSGDQAQRTRAVRRAKVTSIEDGRFVVEYRGNQITLGSSWPGKINSGAWVDVVQGASGTLEIAGPSGYAGG